MSTTIHKIPVTLYLKATAVVTAEFKKGAKQATMKMKKPINLKFLPLDHPIYSPSNPLGLSFRDSPGHGDGPRAGD